VASELREVLTETLTTAGLPGEFTHRLTTRRMREVQNTMYHHLPAIRRFVQYNPAWLHPDDLRALGLTDGDEISLVSAHGCVQAIAAADPSLRTGMVAMTHGFGAMPGEAADYREVGANTNLLTGLDQRDPINAMPAMSAIAVRIERASARQPQPATGGH
jgi:anaerobic selenocysteine-containing dehydrogenase